MFQKAKALFIFFICLLSFSALAQKSYNINSPYSRIGIGELAPEGSIRNFGMGGTGVSNAHPEFLNIINPALLINNRARRYDSLYNILDATMRTELRKETASNGSLTSGTANFFSFTYTFPVSKRWVTAVSLKPYTNASYSFISRYQVSGTTDSAIVNYTGSGGVYRAELANAYRLSKHFNLGLSTSYLFGSINRESFSQLINFPDSAVVGSNQKAVYSGFLFRPGIVFRKKWNERLSADSAVFFNIGVTYDFFAGVKSNNELLIDRRTNANFVISRITNQTGTTHLTFPPTLRAGVSFDKYSSWNVALDFTYWNWKNFNGASTADTLKNSFNLALGGEWVVGYKGNNLDPLKRKYLRAGLSYTQTPYYIDGRQIHDFSVSVGTSLPLGNAKFFRVRSLLRPSINIALIAGQRGTMKDNLIKEQYVKAFIGITVNDKWFAKRRLE